MLPDTVIPVSDGLPGDWSCAACTFINSPTKINCEMCGYANPVGASNILDWSANDSQNALLVPDPSSPQLFQPRKQMDDSNNKESEQKKPSKNKIYCAICMDTIPANDCPTIDPCNHQVCQPCLTNYLEFEIISGNVRDIHCPLVVKNGQRDQHEKKCTSSLNDAFIKQMVSEEIFQKFKLFERLKGDPTLRQCPKCNHIQQGNPKEPKMICEKLDCNFKYCYFHASAHLGSTCKEYQSKNKTVLQQTKKFVTKECIPCTFCKAPVIKSSGCNHMTCTQCKGEFCYLCGGLNRGGKHFATHPPWNYLYGCAGLRMAENKKVHSRDTLGWHFIQCICTIPFFVMLLISPFVFVLLELMWCLLLVGLCPIWCCGALCAICITQDQDVVFVNMSPYLFSGTRLYYRYKYWWVGPAGS